MQEPIVSSGTAGLGRAEAAGSPMSSSIAAPQAPVVTLPKGGGAIRGIGEKFGANTVTGTGSLSIPLALSSGRSGFGPQLTLSYDSGAGNGPFGLGWSLALPAIIRKTDLGLPQYHDAADSDVFMLSGAEDLVPTLVEQGGAWVPELVEPQTIGGTRYIVRRYRPRVEGLFARIERWTDAATGDVHWRSISRDNITTLYGLTNESRIFDPAEVGSPHPRRIFSWLICQSYDDRGNAVVYRYQGEDGRGIFENQRGESVALAHEQQRTPASRSANRYLKRIFYGNRTPNRDLDTWQPLNPALLPASTWMFEAVFDYGEGHYDENGPDAEGRVVALARLTPPAEPGWPVRSDPFSTYRAGFEVRSYRLCQRVLMFHHFPEDLEIGPSCLVRSTDFGYAAGNGPAYTTLKSVAHSSYRRRGDSYLKRSLPPLQLSYSQPTVQETVEELDPANLEQLPVGLDGANYQWVDLHGEGVPGILTEQGGAWFYKRNLSPANVRRYAGQERAMALFASAELVDPKPNLALNGAQLLDLAGDGQPDLVSLDGPTPGLYEHDEREGWQPFRPFVAQLNRDFRDPNLRLVDLDGDGLADVLISEGDGFTWHPSLAEQGFGPARRVAHPADEERGPRLLFADGTASIYLADMSGDGLTDLVRIRNGEVCYWPNLGYGRFGAKVAMDRSPRFDRPDQFEQRRVRLADIDGTGTADLIYLHAEGVRLYFNRSGNSWSDAEVVPSFPAVDDVAAVMLVDLLGNGTACLVWSSPLPGERARPMRFVNLMGGQKPHLLTALRNGLGAETTIQYAPSTRFYLQDRRAGRPWITRLPFPVHVVERVETLDQVSGNRFVTRYAYHHGFFDGEEREFRGFGMVEQWDSEEPTAAGLDGSRVPPTLTRTWFHTGVFLGRERVSRLFAGLEPGAGRGEYFRERPWLDDSDEASRQLLSDTLLPPALSPEEAREACRTLKGTMLRQEVYALDGVGQEPDYPYGQPYTVAEQNLSLRRLQPRGPNRHAVFLSHPNQVLTFHYERNEGDPRIQHALTLEVGAYGNVLKEAAISYGRRRSPLEQPWDRDQQTTPRVVYTEHLLTNAIDTPARPADYRTPLPAETCSYELSGYLPTGGTGRFTPDDFVRSDPTRPGRLALRFDQEIAYEAEPGTGRQRRLIEQTRTLYRRDDLGRLLPLGELQAMALPGESYRLAFSSDMVSSLLRRDGQPLLPALATVLGGQGFDQGGYLAGSALKADGRFPAADPDDRWWISAGRALLSPSGADSAAQELAYARRHFFLPHRFRDPFGHQTVVRYDDANLLVTRTADAAANTVAAINDYRVLQPRLVTDPNGNRNEVCFDTLGMVAGTAVMGKADAELAEGDSFATFDADLAPQQIAGYFDAADPRPLAVALLGTATTRIVYDLERIPSCAATIARETHTGNLAAGAQPKVQLRFSYSDGFARVVQQKLQAEPGRVPRRDAAGAIVVGPDGQPELTPGPFSPRWVGSGWTIYNNKGLPVRQFESFFSDTHRLDADVRIGVSPWLLYDPLGRVVATLHPDHSWEKVVFDPWRQATYDLCDTLSSAEGAADPRLDPHVGGLFRRLPEAAVLPTWYEQRLALPPGNPDRIAAEQAAAHRDTPTIAHLDALSRTFLTVAHNRFRRELPGGASEIVEEQYHTRVTLDIEGNQREVRDALGRLVLRSNYDMLGTLIRQANMEAGERWILSDALGKPIRAWDSRGFARRMAYDELRRPTSLFVSEDGAEREAERTVYGEGEGVAGNHRTQVYQVYDGAGIATSEAYDFKGNLLRSRRDLLPDYRAAVDWRLNPAASDGTFTSSTSYDALNRPATITAPDGSVYRPSFNEANLLDRVELRLRGAAELSPVVNDIAYDAKGQRLLIRYANGASTSYDYDPLTFHLRRLRTTRPPGRNGLAPIFAGPNLLQDLRYWYDPVGNITRIEDGALAAVAFNNQQIAPVATYSYDAIYRLVEATGREQIAQTTLDPDPAPGQRRDYQYTGARAQPNNLQALRNYAERYEYDAVGNFRRVRHAAAGGSWTRSYGYEVPSLLEAELRSNRLSSSQLGDGPAGAEAYSHDAHGNLVAMPGLAGLSWDFADRLREVNLGGGGRAYYVYDAGGQRVRKVIERQNGTRQEERIYLGGFELYRAYRGDGAAVTLARETLHVMDDQQRVALVETRSEPTPGEPLLRYQLANHLGSVALELSVNGDLISYEEYHPYGTTAFQAHTSAELSQKRYRYSGKERDEETGFGYHGARYYAPWLGRWVSCDPLGLVDGPNLYAYVRGNPAKWIDPQGTEPKKPPFPSPKDNPQKFISDNQNSLENWMRGLEAEYHQGRWDLNLMKYIEEVQKRPPGPQTKEGTNLEYARSVFDRLRTRFYKNEAANPTYDYTPEQLERLKAGSAPEPEVQIDHIERLANNPARAADPNNLAYTQGGPGGGLPKGSPHYERHRGPGGRRMETFQKNNPSTTSTPQPSVQAEPQPVAPSGGATAEPAPATPRPAAEPAPAAPRPAAEPTPEPQPTPPARTSTGGRRPGGSGRGGGGVGGVLLGLNVLGLLFQYWDFHDAREEGRRRERLKRAEPGLYIYTDPATGQQKQYIVP